MKYPYFRLVKQVLALLFLALFLTSCVYKNIDGSNNFHSFVNSLVEKSVKKLNENLYITDTVLVSDFVNIDRLENRSKLGFLLSSTLKDRLLANNITVREVELRKHFTIGQNGFNLLSRDASAINRKIADARYAFVGTYTLTTKNLIVFIKMIDLDTGNILSSSQGSVMIDEEIIQLERKADIKQVYTPMVL